MLVGLVYYMMQISDWSRNSRREREKGTPEWNEKSRNPSWMLCWRCLCLWSKSASQSLRALVKPLVCQRYDTSLHTIITELSIPISFVWMNFELLTNFRVKKKKSNWKKSRLPSIWLGWPLSLHFRFLIIRLERLPEKRQVAEAALE